MDGEKDKEKIMVIMNDEHAYCYFLKKALELLSEEREVVLSTINNARDVRDMSDFLTNELPIARVKEEEKTEEKFYQIRLELYDMIE